MTAIASQIILHPVVSNGLRFGGTTLGRDKAYRSVQYFARFYAWYLLSKGDTEAAARWIALKIHLGIARKLLRLGKPLENLQAALKAALVSGPAGEQITAIAKQMAYFAFLTCDGLTWSSAISFYSFSSEMTAKLTKLTFRFWLAGIILSIVNGSLKSLRLAREERMLRHPKTRDGDAGQEAVQSGVRTGAPGPPPLSPQSRNRRIRLEQLMAQMGYPPQILPSQPASTIPQPNPNPQMGTTPEGNGNAQPQGMRLGTFIENLSQAAGQGAAQQELRLSSVLASRDSTRYQLVLDLLDLWIPATALGISNMNDGVLGIIGLISSLMSGKKHWESVKVSV